MESAHETADKPWWHGRIERRRDTCSNRWRIAGTRITVDVIKSFHDAGYSAAHIIAEYPSLTVAQVNDAINFNGPDRP